MKKKAKPRPRNAKMANLKRDSINFRATPAEKKLVVDAAKAENLDTGTYVRRSVLKQAEIDLSTRSNFVISEAKMKEFLEALDRPVQKKPNLRKLLTEDSILD